ncbi:MAG: hypothetical protein V2I33_19780 [Kangiellaceae bacterium]|jgi:magnesium-transporting ATPase (P-type)|nr:hypothetical protein [Kangiellaceae bacterium]
MVKEDEQFPADMVFLASDRDNGLAFVNTMNLDGETNLKTKLCHDQMRAFNTEEKISKLFKGTISIEEPNPDLTKWICNFIDMEGVKYPLCPDQALLRGCVLKNT